MGAKNLFQPAPNARHIDSIDGLNLSEVNDIIQDRQGYLWLGTSAGLVRFDGSNAQLYSHDKNDPHSLSHNRIHGLVEDSKGNIWISTYGGGLNKYDPEKDRFEKIALILADSGQVLSDNLYWLTKEGEDFLWIGSIEGMIKFDLKKQQAIPLTGPFADLPKEQFIRTFLDDRGGKWFSSEIVGLYWFDGTTMHHFDDSTGLKTKAMRSVYQDSQGQIWITTSWGLHKFNPDNHTFDKYNPADIEGFSHFAADVFTVIEEQNGKFWLGTVNAGVITFDSKTGTFENMSSNKDLKNQFKPGRVNTTFKDKDGTIWFGRGQGITALPKIAQHIAYLSNEEGALRSYDVKQLNDNTLGIIAELKYYELNLNDFSVEQKFPQIFQPYRFTQMASGDLWFATLGERIQHFNAQKQEVILLDKQDFVGPERFPVAFFDLFTDADQNLWLTPFKDGTQVEGGVVRFDPRTRQFTMFNHKPVLHCQTQLSKYKWLVTATGGGMFELDTKAISLSPWRPDIHEKPERIVTQYQDAQGNLWIGTEAMGLAHLAPDGTQFKYFGTNEGLVSDTILSIIEDDHQQLWLGTPVGLVRFNKSTHQAQNYDHRDGLLFNRFYKKSQDKLKDGRIVMGTYSGLMLFDPKKLSTKDRKPKVLINQFKRFNQPLEIHSKDPTSPLTKPIAYTEQLTLSYKDYLFSFGFTAIELLRPDLIEYAYKMEGLDDQWLYTDANNRWASYTTLAPKDYIFKVKARLGNGPWSEQTQLKLTITPPWWQTYWAMLGYLLLCLGLIFGFIHWRTQRILKHSAELEKKVTERTAELAEKSETVSQLLAQKQRLFASVSHEFRTPLTLILSPIEVLLKNNKDHPWYKDLHSIKRNGQRLLRMVDQLLEFAKLEQKAIQQNETVSLQQTLLLICESFDKLLASKQLKLTIEPFDDIKVTVIHDSLNKILLNLISNAVKYTPDKGSITVTISTTEQQVSIRIKDTGIGIAASDQQSVFERFNRASQQTEQTIAGTGIGLALVKELTEANGGEILLQSEIAKGSTFTVKLPLIDSLNTIDTPVTQTDAMALEVANVTHTSQDDTPSNDEQSSVDNRYTLLIIDDHSDIRSLLNTHFKTQYQCLFAADGEQGLELAIKQLPDLILSDVMMPKMDGYQLAEKLKQNPNTSHIPLFLLTAKGSAENRIKGLKLLVDDYLTKPFNIEELRQRIHNTLSNRELLRKRLCEEMENCLIPPKMQSLGLSNTDQAYIEKIYTELDKHYTDPELTARQFAQYIHVSERQLQRKLRGLIDLTFPELVRSYRLNKALEQLQSGQRVSDIYLKVGFSSHSYFTSCFKTKYGKTPKAYQQSL